MKILATFAFAAAMLAPGIAAACSMHPEHATNISCAAGQVFDEESRSCVPQTG